MRIEITVCEHCKREYCPAISYITKEEHPLYRGSDEKAKMRGCKKTQEVVNVKGKGLCFKMTFGHGDYDYYPVIVEK